MACRLPWIKVSTLRHSAGQPGKDRAPNDLVSSETISQLGGGDGYGDGYGLRQGDPLRRPSEAF